MATAMSVPNARPRSRGRARSGVPMRKARKVAGCIPLTSRPTAFIASVAVSRTSGATTANCARGASAREGRASVRVPTSQFGHVKARYRGLAKNRAHLFTLATFFWCEEG